jgi:molecular chaperone GrpE
MTNEKPKDEPEIEFIPEPEAEGEAPAPAAKKGETGQRRRLDAADLTKAFKTRLRKRDEEIRRLRQEVAGLKDQYLRKLAEMENLRKRLEREKSEYFQYALAEFFLELVGIVDNFERALAAADREGDGATFREGVELIHRLLVNFLHKNGVRPVETGSGAFDPVLHHAMATEESDEVQEPQVIEELQKGYFLKDRLLRPAMVKVRVPRKGE